MACSVPFNKKDLDVSFFVFRPTVVIVDDLVHALKQFSLSAESLGCVQSSLFRSIHGNMIIWYGAWQKRSSKEKKQLTSTLVSLTRNHRGGFISFFVSKIDLRFSNRIATPCYLDIYRNKQEQSMLSNISSMGVLVEHSFLDAYGGESRDGSLTAKFSTGDIISMTRAVTTTSDLDDLCYAVLAIFRSRFAKIEGMTSGLCLKCQSIPRVVCIHVWKSLHFCYSWILNSDHRNWMMPYLERFSINMKYDIFRVVYVSGDNVVNLPCISPHQMLENGKERESRQGVMQN